MIFTPIYVSCASAVLIQIACYFLLFQYLNLGVLGTGICSFISNLSYLITTFSYMKYYSILPEENFWSFSGIIPNFFKFFKISVLSMVIYCAEIMSLAISNFSASRLNPVLYAKHLIGVNLGFVNESLNYGITNASCMLVSNYLELKSVYNVRLVLKKLFYAALILQTSFLLLVYLFRILLFNFFNKILVINSDPDMINYYIYFFISIFFLQYFNYFLIGVLRGFEVLNFITIFVCAMILIVKPAMIAFFGFYLDLKLTGIYIADLILYVILNVTWSVYYWLNIDIDESCQTNETYEMENDKSANNIVLIN